MEYRVVFICFIQIYLIGFCYSNSKDLHSKEPNGHSKNNEMNIIKDYYNNYDEIVMKNERFARHAAAITENVIEHLLHQINQKYPKNGKRKEKLLSTLKKKFHGRQKKTKRRKTTQRVDDNKMI